MKTRQQLLTLALTGLMVTGMFAACASKQDAAETSTTRSEAPKMKMTTPIRKELTTPDKVETSIGTLKFKNGMPDQATMDKLWDNLDFSRAVSVYQWRFLQT